MSKFLGWKSKESGTSAAPFKAPLPRPKEAKGKDKKPKSAHDSLTKRISDHTKRMHSLASKREAEQTTSQPQLVRSKPRESARPIVSGSGFVEVGGRFLEKAPGNNIANARVVLIQEGLGNLGDGYFYTREALQQAAEAKIFEGKKMYADHPSKMEEAILPERSTRDIVGHYEDVAFEEAADGSGMLTANLLLLRGDPYEWVHALVERAVDYSKKYTDQQFIGVSINASGEAQPMDAADFLAQFEITDSAKKKVEDAISEGLNEIKVVRSFSDAVSVDLVTEAGAKGKILELLEAEKKIMTKAQKIKEAQAKKKSAEAKIKEAEAKIKAAGKDAKKLKEAEEAKKEAEAEAKEAKAEEAEAEEADDGDGDGGDDGEGDHDDEDADKALILKMLKKQGLVGDDADEEECHEAMEAGGHYMAAFKQAGYKAEEAAERAAEAMKCAGAVHAAMSKGKGDDADGAGADDSKDGDGDDKPAKNKEAKAMIELKAEVARLREKDRKRDLSDCLENKMKASGLPTHVTKLFKEAVANAKSEKEIDKNFETFTAVYKADRDASFVESVEKNGTRETTNKTASSLDDCVEEI